MRCVRGGECTRALVHRSVHRIADAPAGLTHAALTPVDFVKCRMQVGTFGYTGVFDGVRKIMAEGGAIGLSRGFLPTLVRWRGAGPVHGRC